MAAVALRVTGGAKAFHRDDDVHIAFEGVDLEIGLGEIVALLGPSGCGKSTLLRAIVGLETLDRGSIEVTAGPDPDHAVGIAFQQPSLLPWLTVAGNIGLGLRFAANRAARTDGIVEWTIDELGLAGVADAFPDELSGGQAQRANVARLVVTGRPVLLLDEPFGALDPVTRASLQDWLVELQRSHDLTIVVVTHDVSEALRLGDRIALMSGAPGSIQRIWDVSATVGAEHDPAALELLRREILDDYDTDLSPVPAEPERWPVSATVAELEGAAS